MKNLGNNVSNEKKSRKTNLNTSCIRHEIHNSGLRGWSIALNACGLEYDSRGVSFFFL